MPMQYMNSFRPVGLPAVSRCFLWSDDPTEDAAFAAYVNDNWFADDRGQPQIVNARIDRTVDPAVLRWDRWAVDFSTSPPTYADTGEVDEEPLSEGPAVWFYRLPSGVPATSNIPMTDRPGSFDASGWWVCDAYGRPFNVHDVLAPAAR